MRQDKSEVEHLDKITAFLESVGIDVEFVSIDKETFLPGISIKDGSLLVDKEKLEFPGDLLHEAGHIAVQPGETRHLLNENVNESGQGDGEEMAAIAWSWAALTEIGLPPHVVFHEKGYKGSSKNIVTAFQTGGLFGQPLLGFFQMCNPMNEDDTFPKMQRWLRA